MIQTAAERGFQKQSARPEQTKKFRVSDTGSASAQLIRLMNTCASVHVWPILRKLISREPVEGYFRNRSQGKGPDTSTV